MERKKIKIKSIIQKRNCRARSVSIDTLMASIKQVGLLQPIGVIKITQGRDKGKYEILFGNRRFEAVKKLGQSEIDAQIFENTDDTEMVLMNLIENLQREDINLTEQSRILHQLKGLGLTETEIAARLSVPSSKIKIILGLYKVPKKYHKKLTMMKAPGTTKKGKLPISIADRILQLNKEYSISAANLDLLFQKAMNEGFGNAELRYIISLMGRGFSFNEALKNVKNIHITRVDVPCNKVQLNKLCEKYKLGRSLLVCGIVSGQIKEKIKPL